jgi:hypothetical protein
MSLRIHIPLPGPFSISMRAFPRFRPSRWRSAAPRAQAPKPEHRATLAEGIAAIGVMILVALAGIVVFAFVAWIGLANLLIAAIVIVPVALFVGSIINEVRIRRSARR